MAQHSKIEWTESTWNPVTGCTKISAGCLHCYAERMAKRLCAMGNSHYRNGFKVTLHPEILEYPLRWKRPHTIFVNSMSDIFHEEVPDEYILQIFHIMNQAFWHRFQVLTKRSERLLAMNQLIHWTDNIWMGVTVENAEHAYRIDHLRNTQASVKFLSLEPLLGPLTNLSIEGIDWIIVGGESGPMARPIKEEWVREIHEHCIQHNIPFFFKQWGGVNKKKNGRMLDGQVWEQIPQKTKEVFNVQSAAACR